MASVRNLLIRISVSERTDTGIRKVNNSLREMNRQIDSADKSSNRFSRTLSSIGRISGAGLRTFGRYAFYASAGIAALGTAAAGVNTAIQLTSALAPLTGLLALLPAAALAAGAAFGTLKLATSGVGAALKDAFSGTASPEKLAKELQGLAPAARSFVLEARALKPALDGIKNAAQQAVFAPLRGQLTAIVRTLQGPLKTGFTQVGSAIGQAGVQVATFARQSATVQLIRSAFSNTAASIRLLTPAIQPVLAGFRSLAQVGLSFIPGLAASVSVVAQRFGAWMQQMAASGRAAAWISNALATLRQLGGIAVQVGGILKSVFSAASAAGSGFLGVIGQSLAQLNAFLKTTAGQTALTAFFQGLAAVGRALAPVIQAVVTQLGQLAAPIGRLAVQLGPLLVTAINAIGPALRALEPGFQALFQGLGRAFRALAPALVPLGQAIAQIGVALRPILPLAGQLIAQLVSGLAPILGRLFVAISPLVGAILKLGLALAPLIPPIANIIVQLVQGLVPVLTPLIGIFSQIAVVIVGFLVRAFQMLMPTINQILPIISQMAQQQGRALLQVFVALAPALLTLIQALLPLIPPLVQLSLLYAKILILVAPLLAVLIQLAGVILGVVLPPIVKLATYLLTGLAYALNFVVGLVSKIVGWIVAPFKWLYNTLVGHSIIPDIVNGMIRWFGYLPSRVVSIFSGLVSGAVGQMRRLINEVWKIPGWIANVFKGAGRWLYNAGKNIIYGIINGLWAAAKSLWSALKSIAGTVRSYWPFSPAKTGPLSGKGSLDIAGAKMTQMLASGMLAGRGAVSSASQRLASAASVTPSAVSPAMAGGAYAAPAGVAAGQGAGLVKVSFDFTGIGDAIAQDLRKRIRVEGGNVQTVLGTGAG